MPDERITLNLSESAVARAVEVGYRRTNSVFPKMVPWEGLSGAAKGHLTYLALCIISEAFEGINTKNI